MEVEGRRRFLGVLIGGIAAAVAAAVVWPLYRYLAPPAGSGERETVVIPEADLGEGQAKFFQYAGSSAVLVRKQGGQVAAFSAVCTHLGCIVKWEKEKQEFLCPCHGGRFSAEGAVIAGPPPKPLSRLDVAVSGGKIVVGKKQEAS